jgi:hypothetical protein
VIGGDGGWPRKVGVWRVGGKCVGVGVGARWVGRIWRRRRREVGGVGGSGSVCGWEWR